MNDWGRMMLLRLEADQDGEAIIVTGKHGVIATVGSSSRRRRWQNFPILEVNS